MPILSQLITSLGLTKIGAHNPSAFASLIVNVATAEAERLSTSWRRSFEVDAKLALQTEYAAFLLLLTDRLANESLSANTADRLKQATIADVAERFSSRVAPVEIRRVLRSRLEPFFPARMAEYSNYDCLGGPNETPENSLFWAGACHLTRMFCETDTSSADYRIRTLLAAHSLREAAKALAQTSSYKWLKSDGGPWPFEQPSPTPPTSRDHAHKRQTNEDSHATPIASSATSNEREEASRLINAARLMSRQFASQLAERFSIISDVDPMRWEISVTCAIICFASLQPSADFSEHGVAKHRELLRKVMQEILGELERFAPIALVAMDQCTEWMNRVPKSELEDLPDYRNQDPRILQADALAMWVVRAVDLQLASPDDKGRLPRQLGAAIRFAFQDWWREER